ncbi:MAG: ATP-binding cassette domain-containing protein [Nitrospirota bacterium]|nr:ATP-binding cassette domain-containing protein [Nitrospirota bacterium]
MDLILKNISRTYDDHVALDDCSFFVRGGSFTMIIGPNGSGKSTLLRIASLLESPDTGEAIYHDNGGPIKRDIFLKRKIAVVLPGNSLFNDTVFNNVAYGLRVRDMNRHVVRERVHDILERFQLSGKAYRNALTLSSGESQRTALSRALVTGPEYLFLDEPTASLDPVNTEIIEKVLNDIVTGDGMTVVMITHNMFQARRLADRVAFIYGGRVIEEAKSEKIFSSPRKDLTRGFVTGKMVW